LLNPTDARLILRKIPLSGFLCVSVAANETLMIRGTNEDPPSHIPADKTCQ